MTRKRGYKIPQILAPTFEHHHSGLGVSTSRPRISWRFVSGPLLDDADGSSSTWLVRNWRQTTYTLQFSRPSGGTTTGGGASSDDDVYVQRDGSDSVLVPWPVEPLKSRELVWVRVRVTGFAAADSGAGEQPTASDWSPWAAVEAALLERSDWTAQMIGPSQDNQPYVPEGPLPVQRLRKTAELPGHRQIVQARLYATAYGVYEASIDGIPVGDHVMAPGWTSYHHRLNYQVYDVTSIVEAKEDPDEDGESGRSGRPLCIAFEVAEGWYAGRLGFGGGHRCNYGSEIGVLGQLEVVLVNLEGELETVVVNTDDTWTARKSPIVSGEIYDGEVYDQRQETPGWNVAATKDQTGWTPVKVLEFPAAKLVSPDAPPIRVVEKVPAQKVFQTPAGKTIVDFGQNLVGKLHVKAAFKTTPRVSSSGDSAVTIRFVHAEVMDKSGELGTRPLRTAKCTDAITLGAGAAGIDWVPKYTYHGFRFVQVDNWPGTLDTKDLTGLVAHTDFPRTGTFSCSHPLVNRLHENALWSMRGNFFGLPTDCPQRDERFGWTGDIQAFASSACFLYGAAGMLSGWLEDLAVEQFLDPAHKGSIPPQVVPYVPDTAPAGQPVAVWGDAAVLTPWDVYEASGDVDVLERQYTSMTTWVDRGIPKGGPDDDDGGGGLLWDPNQWQYGDWLDPKAPANQPADARTDGVLVANAYLVHVTRRLAAVSGLLGKPEAAKYAKDAADRLAAFRYKYMAPSGLLVGDTQTGLSMAIVFGFYDDSQLATAGKRLGQLVAKDGFRVATGFAGTPLVTHALTATGQTQTAYRMLQEQSLPSWLYPVTMGATTIWERWDSMLPDGSINPGSMTSFNHYALGSVVHWLHGVVGGLKARTPGWRTFWVQPQPGGSIWQAETVYESPYGAVKCKWEVVGEEGEEREFFLQLVVPPNTEAYLTLPGQAGGGGGGAAAAGEKVVGSGTHSFKCPYVAEPAPAEVEAFFAADKY